MIINLTQHPASREQIAEGVVEPDQETKARIRELLVFSEPPSTDEIEQRAQQLAKIAKESGATSIMIGGALFLMSSLERALRQNGLTPIYAFSRREATEERLPDGTVRKTSVFRHIGFVEPPK